MDNLTKFLEQRPDYERIAERAHRKPNVTPEDKYMPATKEVAFKSSMHWQVGMLIFPETLNTGYSS